MIPRFFIEKTQNSYYIKDSYNGNVVGQYKKSKPANDFLRHKNKEMKAKRLGFIEYIPAFICK